MAVEAAATEAATESTAATSVIQPVAAKSITAIAGAELAPAQPIAKPGSAAQAIVTPYPCLLLAIRPAGVPASCQPPASWRCQASPVLR